ncbi:peptide chain release factor 1 [Candidatus Micrarchaeota archaeon]|nr:peptide chain release factor 1 [Candidatus Micrarchaeota archaeon]
MAETKETYEFKKQLEALSKFQGRGTELISVYITPKYPISEITAKLRDEHGQASNIKSASTRKNVQAALEKIMQYLKTFKEPPANGIAVFCGNVSETEGKTDIGLYSVIPPQPIAVQFYRCESRFVLEPLEELLAPKGIYGLVVMDGKEATVAVLRGKQIKVLKKITSTAQQKVVKGGQSAARFQRIHEETVEAYYKRIGEAMDAFVEMKGFKGVIVGGPGPSKENFLNAKPFNYQIKILGVVDIGYTDEYGLREALDKSSEIIADQEAVKEKKLLDEFMKEVSRGGLAVYGIDDIRTALESNQASKLLVSEGMGFKEFTLQCPACGKTVKRYGEKPPEEECPCGGRMKVAEEKDVAEEFIELAEAKGIPVEMISDETAEGAQFKATFKGLGVFLRYK